MVKMTQEDRQYFKNGVKTLCGTELVFAIRVIEDKDMKKVIDSKDLEFMKKGVRQTSRGDMGEIA